ncbi:MAG TPA: glutathione S-transferase family protein [Dongiaceae bacterium]
MYTLFYSPGSASMAPHAVLEEIGVPYLLKRVDISSDKPRDPEYLKLNPLGRVPTLVVTGGETIYESAAIVMYLADRHSEAKLAPALTDPQRGLYTQWMFHLTNTLQDAYLLYFYPDRNTTQPEQAPGIRDKAVARVDTIWGNLDQALARRGPYLLGDRFSAADIYMHMLYCWHEPPATLAAAFPAVKRCAELVGQRPPVKRMLGQNDMAA